MEDLPTLSEVVLQDMPIDFFDFTFILNADGSMKECKFNGEVLEPAIGSSLFVIRENTGIKARG